MPASRCPAPAVDRGGADGADDDGVVVGEDDADDFEGVREVAGAGLTGRLIRALRREHPAAADKITIHSAANSKIRLSPCTL